MNSFAASVAAVSAQIAESVDTPTVYITNHVLSQHIAGAFAEGCKGKTVELPEWNDKPSLAESSRRLIQRGLNVTGPIAVYGILRGCGEVINFAKWTKQDFWHIDNGYVRQTSLKNLPENFGPQHLTGYYRITRNGFQSTEQKERPSDRWDSLGIGIKPKWRRDGRNIVVVPPSGFVSQYQGIDSGIWQAAVQAEIKKRTDRPIQVKVHKGGLEEILPDTFCLVTHESMQALHCQIGGVPSIALGNHCIGPLSWTWKNLEYPDYFDRGRIAKLCHSLAYEQWTLPEIRSGKAWRMLHENL